MMWHIRMISSLNHYYDVTVVRPATGGGGGVLEVLHEDRKSKLFIRDIKYSPDGETLAIASEDGKVRNDVSHKDLVS